MAAAPDELQWIPEARALQLCGVARSTWQTWIRQGLVDVGHGGTFSESDVLAVVFVAALRGYGTPSEALKIWRALQQTGAAHDFVERARKLDESSRLDLVIEPDNGRANVAGDSRALVQAVRHPEAPRRVIVVPLAEELRRVRDGFRALANVGPPAATRRRGRPRLDRPSRLRSSP